MIAVFDIGKTNKKLFVFDEEYKIVHETSAHLDETKDEDGDACEDVVLLTNWIQKTFNEVSARFDIRAVNFSTYGASFVHVGNDGRPVAPLYNYLKPFPDDLKQQFYDTYGGQNAFAKTTASPVLGSLNSGMILYLLKYRKPEVFERINRSLHLPQYVSSLFTSSACSDLTSIGCHTNLWDFTAHRYHDWVKAEGVASKLAPIRLSNATYEINAVHKILYSGIGLHDSSAALIPYLMHSKELFVLLSTGTWCITLNPFNESPLTAEELTRDCLCYLSYEGKPVKASRLFSGFNHEAKCRDLSQHFGVAGDAYKDVISGESWMKHVGVFNAPDLRVIFDTNQYTRFTSFEQGYACLIEHLVAQQVAASNLVLQDNTKVIYVDGGFSQNEIFMKLLAKAYPDKKVYAASVVQASALGAALAIHSSWNKKPVPADLLQLSLY